MKTYLDKEENRFKQQWVALKLIDDEVTGKVIDQEEFKLSNFLKQYLTQDLGYEYSEKKVRTSLVNLTLKLFQKGLLTIDDLYDLCDICKENQEIEIL